MRKFSARKWLSVATLVFLSTVIPNVTFGQVNTSSPYSMFGLGHMNRPSFGLNSGIGGSGIAWRSAYQLNPVNPASYSEMKLQAFLFDFGGVFRSTTYQTTDNSTVQNDWNLDHIAIGFRATKWWFWSAGIMPGSSIGYQVEQVKYGTTGYDSFILNQEGSGGLTKVYLGNAFVLAKGLSLGFNANLLFGPVKSNTKMAVVTVGEGKEANYDGTMDLFDYIEDRNGDATVSSQQDKFFLSTFNATIGLQYSYKINDKFAFTLGAVLDNKVETDTKQDFSIVKSYYTNGKVLSSLDTVLQYGTGSQNISLPSNLGVGVVLHLGPKYTLGFDYYEQDWTKAKLTSVNDAVFRKATSYLVGAQFMNNPGSAKLLDNIRFSCGAYHNSSYFLAKDNIIYDTGFTIGVGIPQKSGGAIYNIAAQFGRMGTTTDNLVQENYVKLSVNLSMYDIWFKQRKFD